MKTVLIMLVLFVVGCSKGGSKPPIVIDDSNNPPVICKQLASVWTSTVDYEKFDFTYIASGNVDNDYSFLSYDNPVVACGYKNNPNHTLSTLLQPVNHLVGVEYYLQMNASLALAGSCARYQTSANGGKLSKAYLITSVCNQVTICKDHHVTNGPSDCKVFQ